MRAFVASILAVIVIAAGSIYLLGIFQRSAYQAFKSDSTVRLSVEEAGHNLVGKDWH